MFRLICILTLILIWASLAVALIVIIDVYV